MKTEIDPFAIFAPPIITLAVLVLGYVQSRIIRRGRPLSSIQRKLMFYGPVFTLGMTYAIAFNDQLTALFRWEKCMDRRDCGMGRVVGGDRLDEVSKHCSSTPARRGRWRRLSN